MSKQTPAQTKYVSFLQKKFPHLSKNDITAILSDTKKFVTVVQRIYTQPQAKITYKDIKVKGKNVKQRIITSDIKEVMKVADKSKKKHDISELLSNFHQKVTTKI